MLLIAADELLRVSNQKITKNKINRQPVVSKQDDITPTNPTLRLICNKKLTKRRLSGKGMIDGRIKVIFCV